MVMAIIIVAASFISFLIGALPRDPFGYYFRPPSSRLSLFKRVWRWWRVEKETPAQVQVVGTEMYSIYELKPGNSYLLVMPDSEILNSRHMSQLAEALYRHNKVKIHFLVGNKEIDLRIKSPMERLLRL